MVGVGKVSRRGWLQLGCNILDADITGFYGIVQLDENCRNMCMSRLVGRKFAGKSDMIHSPVINFSSVTMNAYVEKTTYKCGSRIIEKWV